MDTWVFALIPIAAIFAGVIKDILKVRATQRSLGQSNRELEQVTAELKRKNEDLAQRLENLEAIVVSRTWNVLHEPGLSEGERQLKLTSAVRHELQSPSVEEINRQRAEQLARRIQG